MFLPDRYVKGTCPRLRHADQYGDNCENLRRHLRTDRSEGTASRYCQGATPELRESEHFFFKLGDFSGSCANGWPADGADRRRQGQAAGMAGCRACARGTSRAMRPTSASRFPAIRASTSTSGWTRRSATSPASRPCANAEGLDFDPYLAPGHDTELHHFIGKDIVNFHGLFWPAVLHGAGFRAPTGCTSTAT